MHNHIKVSSIAVALALLSSPSLANDFFNEANNKLELRNYFIAHDIEDADGSTDSYQDMVTSLLYNFKSGYYKDIIGIDAGAHGGFDSRFWNNGGHDNNALLQKDKTQEYILKYELALKMQPVEDMYLSYGTQQFSNKMIKTKDNRATPSLNTGFNGTYNTDLAKFTAMYLTHYADRNEQPLGKYSYNGKDAAVSVGLVELKPSKNLKVNFGTASQEGIKDQYYAEGNYKFNIADHKLTLNSVYRHVAATDSFAKDENIDKDANFFALWATHQKGIFQSTFSWTKFNDSNMHSGDKKYLKPYAYVYENYNGKNAADRNGLRTPNGSSYISAFAEDADSYRFELRTDLSDYVEGLRVTARTLDIINDEHHNYERVVSLDYKHSKSLVTKLILLNTVFEDDEHNQIRWKTSYFF